MFFKKAEGIVLAYIGLFTDSSITSKLARYDTLLPYPKETIVKAYKVYMVFIGIFRCVEKERVNFLLNMLNKLNSFVSKKEADHINLLHSRISAKKKVFSKKPNMSAVEIEELGDFIESSSLAKEHDEVIEVLNKTQIFVHDWVVNQNGELDSHGLYKHIFEEILQMNYVEDIGIEFYNNGIKQFNSAFR